MFSIFKNFVKSWLDVDNIILISSTLQQYCGYNLPQTGITANSNTLKAIVKFPEPLNLTDLCSFMSLANQLRDFRPALTAYVNTLRPLLSPQKLVHLDLHSKSFEHVKTRTHHVCSEMFRNKEKGYT